MQKSQPMDIPPQIKYTQSDNTVESSKVSATNPAISTNSESHLETSLPDNTSLASCPGLNSSLAGEPTSVNHLLNIDTPLKKTKSILLPKPSDMKTELALKKEPLEEHTFPPNLTSDLKKSYNEGSKDNLRFLPPANIISPGIQENAISQGSPIITVESAQSTDLFPTITGVKGNSGSAASSSTIPLAARDSSFSGFSFSNSKNSTLFTPSSILTPVDSGVTAQTHQNPGKAKTLRDVLYSSTPVQTTFPKVFSEVSSSRKDTIFPAFSSGAPVQPSDGFRPLTTHSNITRNIALPLPLVARHSNEPQFIKSFPGDSQKGLSSSHFSFKKTPSNSSLSNTSLPNRPTKDAENKRNSPPFDSLDNSEDPSLSPKNGKRPRKYIRSGKYSKLKSKGSEGEYSPCPSTPWTPAHSQNSLAPFPEIQAANSNMALSEHMRTAREIEHHRSIKERIHKSLHSDQLLVSSPDCTKPFESLADAFTRLVPYHLYQYPDESFSKEIKNDFKVARIESSYKTLQGRLSALGQKLRNEEKRILPLSILVDHLLVKQATKPSLSPSNTIDNNQSLTVASTPLFERLSSAAPSEPTVE